MDAARTESLGIVLTPVVVMVTFALGLHVGAQKPVRSAVVYGAPPASGRTGLSWQIVTIRDDRGVREAIAVDGLTVTARANGRSATWRGGTNSDGVAELWFDLGAVHRNDRVDLVVRADGEASPLAEGVARWEQAPWGPPDGAPAFARPSKREGALAVDLAVDGERLAPTVPTSLWVHVLDRSNGQPVAGATLIAEPEPGLSLGATRAVTCANGWGELRASAEVHVVGLGLRAEAPGGRHGTWYGAVPVAPGGCAVSMPRETPQGAPFGVDVSLPSVGTTLYLEVDDRAGRAFAAALPLASSPDTMPHGHVDVPPLGEGLYWLVTSSEPRGAERLSGSTIARPFRVEGGPAPDRCQLGPSLATAIATPFGRWVALDGLAGKRGRDGSNRARGLFIAVVSLVLGATLETLLLLRASARSRRELDHVVEAMGDAEGSATALRRHGLGGSLLVGLLLALLGFALLAALLSLRTGS